MRPSADDPPICAPGPPGSPTNVCRTLPALARLLGCSQGADRAAGARLPDNSNVRARLRPARRRNSVFPQVRVDFACAPHRLFTGHPRLTVCLSGTADVGTQRQKDFFTVAKLRAQRLEASLSGRSTTLPAKDQRGKLTFAGRKEEKKALLEARSVACDLLHITGAFRLGLARVGERGCECWPGAGRAAGSYTQLTLPTMGAGGSSRWAA